MISRPYVGVLNQCILLQGCISLEKKNTGEKSALSKVQQGVRLPGINSSVRVFIAPRLIHADTHHALISAVLHPEQRGSRAAWPVTDGWHERGPHWPRALREKSEVHGKEPADRSLLEPAPGAAGPPHRCASRVSRVRAVGAWSRELPSWESSAQKIREKKQQQELSGRMPSVRARCTLSSSKHHHENSAGSSD